ncbi:uncharacterized protein LOC124917349 [Impatiens glandulifera]|uniref:uncharacterized protein LOC124917349 n=1 Tax=Impatiens glandulifera TaxID=253017 RepID=UPI001FB0B5F1|nr:uncharacterized protein LOC124917349 [Impatiens glandulifera]
MREAANHQQYKQFMSFKPRDFKRSTDPMVAVEWIQSIKTIFEFMQCNNSDRLRCATFMFKDDARIWWQGAKSTLDLNAATWAEFKAVFYGKYFTLNTRNKLAREFLEIRQGDSSVADYVKNFERGKYFTPMITGNNDIELNHFLEGLNATILRDVRLSNTATMGETIDRALMAEKDSQDIVREAQTKRSSYQGRDSLGRQGTSGALNNSNSSSKEGHHILDQQTRLTCQLPLVIFVGSYIRVVSAEFRHTRVTNSFISAFFVQQAVLKPVESLVVYKISLPAGPDLKTNRFIIACETQLQNHKMFVDLEVVKMSGFDVILGMDWLLRHEAQINCKDKSVALIDHDQKAFLFQAQ